jgi:phospholipase/carboxylesterase
MNLDLLPLEAVFFEAEEKATPDQARFLIVLHGRGDSPEGFFWMPETMKFPKLNYLLLQAPDSYYGGYSWYDMPPDQLPGILNSRNLLGKTLEAIWAEGFKPEHTVLFGFSQGCLMTLEFGARMKHALAGYVGVSGYLYDADALANDANAELKNAHWLVTHGTEDDVLPVERTRAQIEVLKNSGFKIEYVEYPKVHTLDDLVELPMIREWISARLG